MGLGVAIVINGSADKELAQASLVEVYERMGDITTYRIRYELDVSEGDFKGLTDGRLDTGSELSVIVPVDNSNECLVKGPVHGQQIHFEHGGAGSWFEVRGSDTSIVMDRIARTTIWEDLKDSDAVLRIIENYGYTSDVQETSSAHSTNKHALVQRDSDLRFIHRLAKRNGFLFWITCSGIGVETAHFKRPPLNNGDDASELVINLPSPNLMMLDITWDVERPTSVEGAQLNLNSKEDLDGKVSGTPQIILGEQSLKEITGDTRSTHLAVPADDAGELQARGEAALIEADWFIRVTCQTSLQTLGKLVRSHTIADVRGAGKRYSGKYFVSSVRHTIDATAHRMDVELVRNGWGD